MSRDKGVELRINQYLDQIRVHLDALTEEEIDDILSSVRSHIDSELQAIGPGEPTAEAVEAVLREMDSPASYATSAIAGLDEDPLESRLARPAVIGAILLPFGIIAALMTFVITGSTAGSAEAVQSSPTVWQWLARFTILPLGILAPFACTALGLVSVSQIRRSRGRISGLSLAVLVAIFYPLIVLDVILFLVASSLFANSEYWNIALPISVLLILVVDFFVIRASWRAANRPTT